MKVKSITYQRVVNLGNYESKRLEMTAEIDESDDLEYETSFLMEMVERKVREDAEKAVESELRQLKQAISSLKQELADLQTQKAQLTAQETDTEIPDGF